jgi:hypothetical protein
LKQVQTCLWLKIHRCNYALGLTKINPGEYLGFKPKIGLGGANWINRNTVYITVVYEKDTQMQPVCKAFPKASNESIIIAKDCTIRATKMGELWIDTNGKNHKPWKQ